MMGGNSLNHKLNKLCISPLDPSNNSSESFLLSREEGSFFFFFSGCSEAWTVNKALSSKGQSTDAGSRKVVAEAWELLKRSLVERILCMIDPDMLNYARVSQYVSLLKCDYVVTNIDAKFFICSSAILKGSRTLTSRAQDHLCHP